MNVYASTRRFNAFRLLKEVARNEGAMDLDEFFRLWEQTGLRYSDCERAIQELVEKGFLERSLRGTVQFIELTESGRAEIRHPHSSMVRRVKDWFTLRDLKERRLIVGGPEQRFGPRDAQPRRAGPFGGAGSR